MAQPNLMLIVLGVTRAVVLLSVPFALLCFLLFAVLDERDFGLKWVPLWMSCFFGWFISFIIIAMLSGNHDNGLITVVVTTLFGLLVEAAFMALIFGAGLFRLKRSQWIVRALTKPKAKSAE